MILPSPCLLLSLLLKSFFIINFHQTLFLFIFYLNLLFSLIILILVYFSWLTKYVVAITVNNKCCDLLAYLLIWILETICDCWWCKIISSKGLLQALAHSNVMESYLVFCSSCLCIKQKSLRIQSFLLHIIIYKRSLSFGLLWNYRIQIYLFIFIFILFYYI